MSPEAGEEVQETEKAMKPNDIVQGTITFYRFSLFKSAIHTINGKKNNNKNLINS